jgi:hypothetical protein
MIANRELILTCTSHDLTLHAKLSDRAAATKGRTTAQTCDIAGYTNRPLPNPIDTFADSLQICDNWRGHTG